MGQCRVGLVLLLLSACFPYIFQNLPFFTLVLNMVYTNNCIYQNLSFWDLQTFSIKTRVTRVGNATDFFFKLCIPKWEISLFGSRRKIFYFFMNSVCTQMTINAFICTHQEVWVVSCVQDCKIIFNCIFWGFFVQFHCYLICLIDLGYHLASLFTVSS